MRHVVPEAMPVGELAESFSWELGVAIKDLYSMAGLVFLADFFSFRHGHTFDVPLSTTRNWVRFA